MEFRFTDAKIQLPVEIGPELWQALEQQSNQFQQSGVLVEQLQLVLPLHRCDVALPEDDPDEVQTRRMATLPHMRPITVDVRIRRPDLLLQNLHVDRLTELFIENCDMFAEAQACAVLSRCVHLQQLLLSTTKAGRVVLHESFAPTLSTLKQLTELTLHVRLPAESYQQLPSTLQDLTLSFLPSKASISHITGLKGLAIKAPACEPSTLLENASLSHLEHLDIIYLNRNACAAEGHAAVWPALPALRELFLHWVDREQHALSPSIAAGIAASTQLTSLLIELTDVPASVDMVETLRPLWNLRRLFLSVMSPKASVSSFGNLFSEGLVSLTSLEFEWPSLPVKSLKQVYNIPDLKRLVLHGKKVGDEGLLAISSNMKKLVYLDVTDCNVTKKGVRKAIYNHRLPMLTWLIIKDKGFDRNHSLRDAMPLRCPCVQLLTCDDFCAGC